MGTDVANVVEQVFPAMLKTQVEKGERKYGVRLTTFNGRNAYEDAAQELVDAFQYVTQLDMERVAMAQLLLFFGVTYNFWDLLNEEVQQMVVKTVGGEDVFKTFANMAPKVGVDGKVTV